MYVGRLSLTNFRNYARLELDIPPGVVLLHGNNAQGKTNLLEAFYFLATTRSPHTSQEQQMVNWTAAEQPDPVVVGRLVADVVRPDDQTQLEMRLVLEEQRDGSATFRREALINRRKVRLMDLLGELRVVMFLPEDVELATGSPAIRRRYMNITLCQVDREYCRALSAFNRVLEQRNALLRRIAEGRGGQRDLLDILTAKMVEPGSRVLARRARFVAEMAQAAQDIYYEELIGGKEAIRLAYLPAWRSNGRRAGDEQMADGDWLLGNPDIPATAERYAQALTEARETDLARGSSTVGPHRDDWLLILNGKDLGQYGSRGQLRTAILALKLAEVNWMKKLTSDVPVLLLDEVIAELDWQRREALLGYVTQQVQEGSGTQALLTATDPGMFPAEFLSAARSMTVVGGRVAVDETAPG